MQRLNPLHTPEWLHNMVLCTGCYADPDRMTGRSTALALELVAKAIKNPHTWVEVVDHHPTLAAANDLRYRMQRIVQLLELQHFVFQATRVCFGEVPRR